MFADFVEFQTLHSICSINRTAILSVQLTTNWLNQARAPLGYGEPVPPPVQVMNIVVVRGAYDTPQGGEWIHYEFATEEAARQAYEAIRDGIAPRV